MRVLEDSVQHLSNMTNLELIHFIDDLQTQDLNHTNNSYDGAISINAIFESILKCRKGVMWKNSVIGCVVNSLDRAITLSQKLNEKNYTPKPPVNFIVYSPKKRDIVAVSFEDRVIQRSFNDNIIYPTMVKSFVKDNCACQKGKGTDYAINHLKKYMFRCFKKYNKDFYYLQIDIHGYYPNMNHEYVENLFKSKLDTNTYQFVESVLHSQYPGEVGYNPGSQLIQIAGISCLNGIDHMCKEKYHHKYYIRYMDDIIILHKDKKVLKETLNAMKESLSKIGFTINDKKTCIKKVKEGITFLGFNFKLTNSGKLLQLVRREGTMRAKKHWKGLMSALSTNKYPTLTYKKVNGCFNAYLRYIDKGGTSYKMSIKLIRYFARLYKKYKEIKVCQKKLKFKK